MTIDFIATTDWWTTSGSTFIPSGIEPGTSDTPSTFLPDTTTLPTLPTLSSTTSEISRSSGSLNSDTLTTYIPSSPVSTFTFSSTTSVSFYQDTLTLSVSATNAFDSASSTAVVDLRMACVGKGLDSGADGLLASLILPTAMGLVIWLVFAIVRPYFRQVYGLREWFITESLRPKPLSSSLFAFLFPHIPLVPSMPSDVSEAGKSARGDSELFPSDEQLSQRVVWISLLIVLGWTVLGLAGALPLYMVSLPCIADQASTSTYGGGYSTLQDLSLARLLKVLDAENIPTTNLIAVQKRDDSEDDQNIRTRLIVLTVFTLVLAMLPALWKILHEFCKVLAYRRRWLEVRCGGMELGWLSIKDAPGFVSVGEIRLKEHIVKSGLGDSLDGNGRENVRHRYRGNPGRHGRSEDQPLNAESTRPEIDIQNVFTIADTHHLALLIQERDMILENLEIAETRYIRSFRISTPDPSIMTYEPPPTDRPYISLPKPLHGRNRSRRKRSANPAFAASSLPTNSFVLPSQYYKLRGVNGLTGGRLPSGSLITPQSFSDSIHSRVLESRLQEASEDNAYNRLPWSSHIGVDEAGDVDYAAFTSTSPLPIPDPRRFGPNHPVDSSGESYVDALSGEYEEEEQPHMEPLNENEEEGWVDLEPETSHDMQSDFNGPIPRRARTPKEHVSSTKRETFPFRRKISMASEDITPPHLRLQQAQPFVRPNDGINFDDLGDIYADITRWRSLLKSINIEIVDAQRNSYGDIADGANVKGWILVGHGLRFIRGVQLVEGRAKEDIRWDVLQNERTPLDTVVLWAIVVIVALLLAVGLTAVAGLAVATAPDVSHFLPFLSSLLDANELASGLATILAPAVAAVLFICIALATVHWATNIRGSISISDGQLLTYKFAFYVLTVMAALFLITVGALIFGVDAFDINNNEAKTVADGSVYISVLAMAILLQVATIVPGLLLLQPSRLWKVIHAEKSAVTPRQRFRAIYPRIYDPTYATSACILAIVFASTFSIIFPLIAPTVVVLLFLTLIAHRFLVGYVYARTHSQTGGLLQLWLLRRFGTVISFQPVLLGLIFLSRNIWIEGGVLVGTGVFVIIFVEVFTSWKAHRPGRKSLSNNTQDALDIFEESQKRGLPVEREGSITPPSSTQMRRVRGSMSSVLEMMSQTLAVVPGSSLSSGPVPLPTETVDDLTATERAARSHPDAPPRLPPLSFGVHADEMSSILYAPELTAPPPIIWLPNDFAGVARSEAEDLQKYHDLRAILDVRAKSDRWLPSR